MYKPIPLFLALLIALFLSNCNDSSIPLNHEEEDILETEDLTASKHGRSERDLIVVANRASASISLIDTRRDRVLSEIKLPDGEKRPEPMYVVYVPRAGRVFVGDRANNQVVVYRSSNFRLDGTIPAGQGVFHMWASPYGSQLWVNNDIDNTITVINPRRSSVLATVALPEDLVAMGGKPHDVFLDPRGRHAFVSLVGIAGDNDYVVRYSTKTFKETGRAAVGKDPHLSANRSNGLLYVPAQNSNEVKVLSRESMEVVETLEVPGAHGAGMTSRYFYTTNLTGGGTQGLFVLDTRRNEIVGSTDTPFPVPHNIAITSNNRKLYVTHSGGTANKVSIYTISLRNPIPRLRGEVTVGVNPFGIASVY